VTNCLQIPPSLNFILDRGNQNRTQPKSTLFNMDPDHHHRRSLSRQPSAVAPTSATGSPGLYQYACITCRSRKVKCNRVITGCAECKKASVQCLYTPRRPRKSQKAQNSLPVRPLAPAEGAGNNTATRQLQESTISRHDIDNSFFQSSVDTRKSNREGGDSILPYPFPESDQLETASSNDTLDGSFLFNIPHGKRDLRSYHPSPRIGGLLWQHYVNNVDILCKILHKPTVEALIMSSSKDVGKIEASIEALLFSIYFATITTMSTYECLKTNGEERSLLLPRYRYALEQALAQAGLLTTQEPAVLQAMILFMVSPSNSFLDYL